MAQPGTVSEADLQELVASFRRGATVKVLAGQYDIHEHTVKRVLRRYGTSRRISL